MSEEILSLFYCWGDVACDGDKCPNNKNYWNPNEGSNVTECKLRNRHFKEAWDCRKKMEKLGIAYSNNDDKIRLTGRQMALVRERVRSVLASEVAVGGEEK